MPRKVVYTDSSSMTLTIFGPFDTNLQKVERTFEVRIYNNALEHAEGDAVIIEGAVQENVDKAYKAVEFMKNMSSIYKRRDKGLNA